MRKNYIKFIVILFFGVLSCAFTEVKAQVRDYYSTSFELFYAYEPWYFLEDTVSNNAWKSSQPASHEYRCMGVRSNSAAVSSNLNYEDTVASTAVMYKGLALPAGDYEVYFDWRAGGEVNGDYLSVCLITNPNTVLDIDSGGALPSWYASTVVHTISNQLGWKHCYIPFTSVGTEVRIAFVWHNNGNRVSSATSGCVDNFHVRPLKKLNYSNGFETERDAADFMFNTGLYSSAHWTIGSATALSGTKSLYVTTSADGSTADYEINNQALAIAYTYVTLPAGKRCAVSFDYKQRGVSPGDELGVCLVNDTSLALFADNGCDFPSWYNANLVRALPASFVWVNQTFNIVGTGAPQRIAFVWRNNADGAGNMPGGCIDNFYIRETLGCEYFQGFEDDAENANWVFSAHASCQNKWEIGSADYNIGPKALYISPDGGATNSYVNSLGWVAAYREFVLPAGSVYDLTLDWRCFGEVDADELYVCWLTDSTELIQSRNNSSVPTWATATALPLNPKITGSRKLIQNGLWREGTTSINGTGRPARLVFFWRNNNSAVFTPAPIVDNIQLTERVCERPTNLTSTVNQNNEIVLTWTGAAGSNYDVMYRNIANTMSGSWTVLNNQSSPCTLTGLNKGRYQVWVRHRCDSLGGTPVDECDASHWARLTNIVVITSDGCINFTDIHNSNLVRATYGNYTNPTMNVGVVDFGEYDVNSRHTVNYENRRDANTNGGLDVIPPGELVSVRLGNWNKNYEAETITYTYTVDTTNTILLLKYAVVLQNPSGHYNSQPYFSLEILDMNNQLIDPTCGSAMFEPGVNTLDWNEIVVNSSEKILWKDWTLVGVNLSSHAGQTVKIRLTTKDCNAGQHYGYAYFTLDCTGGKLSGLGCGDNVAEAICAPEGFNYRWYKLHDLNTLVSTDRCITPDANDTSQYVVYVVSETNFNCFFLLNAVLIPRWPKADATFTMRPESCENIVTFTNTSRVVTSNGTPVDGDIEAYYWDFGNGVESTEISPTVNYGSGGGSVTVRLVASMSDDQCTDTTYFNFTLPDLNQAKYEETVTICLGEVYRFNEKDYTETGVYVDTIPLKTGCDSILTLDLTVATIYEASDSLTICYGDTVQFGRFMLTETGFYSDTLPSKAGCDSVVNLYLSVSPVIDVMWDGMPLICEDDGTFNIRYNTLTEAKPTHYSLRFRGDAIRQGFLDVERASADEELTIVMPDGIRAGYYEASVELEDDVYNCGARAFDMKFTVHYSRNVIKQLWNDVLGLKNVNYNGGYDFISYQWFRDGDSIPGATTANYYVAGGELDFNAYYQARILRSDGVVLFTCPFTPVRLPDEINITPIVVVSMQFTVESPKKGRLELYNTSGIRVLTDELVEGESLLRAPALPGVYMVKMVFEDGSVKTSRLIVVSN